MPRVASESANAHTAFLAVCMRRFDQKNGEAQTSQSSSSSSVPSSRKGKERSKPYEKRNAGHKHDKRNHTPGPSEVLSLDAHDGSSCGSPSSPRTPADLQATLPVNIITDDDDFTTPPLPMTVNCPLPEGLRFFDDSVGLLGLRACGFEPTPPEQFGRSALGVQLIEPTASELPLDDMFEKYINKDAFAEDGSA